MQNSQFLKVKSSLSELMGNKPKIIRDKLKDRIINGIWSIFETEKEKNKILKRNIMKK